MFHKILVAIDGSEGANKALRVAIDVARHYEADLHSISVEEHLPHYAATVGEVVEARQEAADYFRRVVQAAEQMATAAGVRLTAHVVPGHEVEAIVQFVKDRGFDLLVIGFMGHSRIYERIWGGTSQNLTRLAPCPVLVVK
ncbi:universal stress protein [Candidatus Nitrospira inopinata]|jgi:nucleotide-binding universal stress UspA family protein|uniref:Universal stress protein n=1 Tax=Candidatus Nitrospira inopinata TaxID=1715989 RepID=A0A0S4KRU1_9BACT|nr:universal stress protein [Candidatus Nitrospira inopinata]CUQ65019.1 Universal stress protein [Candidatus Nitrospira inopinata]